MTKVTGKPGTARTRALRMLAENHSNTELVTPCRLLLVLIVSSIMIAGISFSVVPDDFQEGSEEEVINLTQQPYTFNHEMAMKEREYNLEYYQRPQHHWKVERRSGLSVSEFFDTYDAKWPVILTDVVSKWPAMNWTKEVFIRKYGKERVVMKAVVGGLQHATGHSLPLEVFIDHLHEASFDTWTYLEDELFLVMRPELRKDIGENEYSEENFFNLFPEMVRPWDCMMLWGTAHSRSTLHMDPYNWTGISAVLQGHKKWKLVPPGQDHLLYVNPGVRCGFPLECRKYNSPIDAFDVDTKKYPRFKRLQVLEVDLYSGEMLIIPTGWYHQAFNVEQTLALSQQMMNRNNYLVVLEEIIKAGNLKRKKLPTYFSTLLPPDQSRTPLQRSLFTRNTSLLKRSQLKPSQKEIRGASTQPTEKRNVAWAVTLALAGLCGITYYVMDSIDQKRKKEKIKQSIQVAGKIDIGGKPWTLMDHNGVERTDKDFLGQWTLYYFGFTHCPDVCPEELDKLAIVEEAFKKKSEHGLSKIQLLFVTLDPGRDTPKVIKKYCKEFSPTLLGFTGTEEQLENIRKVYRIFFSTGPVDESGDYLIDHAIVSYLVRPDGSFADYYPKKVTASQMVKQIEAQMKKYEKAQKKE